MIFALESVAWMAAALVLLSVAVHALKWLGGKLWRD